MTDTHDTEIDELVRTAIQDEFAGEIWYESRTNDEQSKKLLSNLQWRLIRDVTAYGDSREARGRKQYEETDIEIIFENSAWGKAKKAMLIEQGREAMRETILAALPPERDIPRMADEGYIGQRDCFRGMNSYRYDVIKILESLPPKQ